MCGIHPVFVFTGFVLYQERSLEEEDRKQKQAWKCTVYSKWEGFRGIPVNVDWNRLKKDDSLDV